MEDLHILYCLKYSGLVGNLGADYFDCGKGKDTIKDFNPSDGDKKSSGCEKADYEGKNHDDDDKSDNNSGSTSAD